MPASENWATPRRPSARPRRCGRSCGGRRSASSAASAAGRGSIDPLEPMLAEQALHEARLRYLDERHRLQPQPVPPVLGDGPAAALRSAEGDGAAGADPGLAEPQPDGQAVRRGIADAAVAPGRQTVTEDTAVDTSGVPVLTITLRARAEAVLPIIPAPSSTCIFPPIPSIPQARRRPDGSGGLFLAVAALTGFPEARRNQGRLIMRSVMNGAGGLRPTAAVLVGILAWQAGPLGRFRAHPTHCHQPPAARQPPLKPP